MNFTTDEPFINFDGFRIQQIIGDIRNLIRLHLFILFHAFNRAQIQVRIPASGYDPDIRIGIQKAAFIFRGCHLLRSLPKIINLRPGSEISSAIIMDRQRWPL